MGERVKFTPRPARVSEVELFMRWTPRPPSLKWDGGLLKKGKEGRQGQGPGAWGLGGWQVGGILLWV